MKKSIFYLFKSAAVFCMLLIISNGNSVNAQTYLMSPAGSDVTCNGNFYDSGDIGGAYSNNENSTHTFCPATAGAMLEVAFTAFDIELNYDFLSIYDGPTAASPLIGTYNGTVSPGTVTSTDPSGCLTFVFTSDGSVTNPGWEAFFSCITLGGPIIMTPGGSNSACAGNFYDSGDIGGVYSNNENSTHTICPATAGSMLEAAFTSFDIELNFDFLSIYDGPTAGSPLIGTYSGTVSPGTVTSTDPSGCLTFVFTSDASVTNPGWEALISCVSPGGPIVMTPGGSNSTCSGNFYDSGDIGGAYSNSENSTHTICPSTAGAMLEVAFTAFDIELNYDFLSIYDGPSAASPLIGTYNGTVSPGTVTSTDPSGCLTFVFTSDASVTNPGWEAIVSCVLPSPIIMTDAGSDMTCGQNFYDSGDIGAAYSNNENSTHTVCPSTAGMMLEVDFNAFDIELNFDFLSIYDGPTAASPLIGTFSGTVSPGTVTSTDASGCLTFVFTSDASVTNPGWEAVFSCVPPVVCADPDVPTVTSSAITTCAGALVTLTIGGNLNDATDWTIYEGSCGGSMVGTTTGTSFDVNPLVTTTYYIRGEGGCVTPGTCDMITINVTPDVTAPVPDIATLLPLSGNCSVTPNPPTATDACVGAIIGVPDLTFPVTAPGTTVVTWTYDDGNGNTTTQLQDLVVNTPDNGVTQNGSILTSNNSSATYQWINCDTGNSPIAGATNQSYIPTVVGNYAVIVSEWGCSDTSACYLVDFSGLTDLSSSFGFKVNPNPSTGLFTVSIAGMNNEKLDVNVFNVVGQTVYSSSVASESDNFEMFIDLSHNETGVYIINILAENGVVLTKRLIKQ